MKQALEQRGDLVELVAIEGEQLSAVTFVQDYVQLHFDGPTLTTITRPTVVAGDASFDYGAAGYRDRLCALIGHVVKQASVRPKPSSSPMGSPNIGHRGRHRKAIIEGETWVEVASRVRRLGRLEMPVTVRSTRR